MTEYLDLAKEANEKLLFIGTHGIGKTKIIQDWAKNNNYHCETLMLSQIEIGDLIGIPYNEDKITKWATPLWLENILNASKKGTKSILFLDEINRGTLDTRQAALQLVLEKKIFTHKLPEDTFIVSAMNPENDYQVEELDEALKDRFWIVEYKPNVSKWIKWANENNIHKDVITFISKKPEFLNTFGKSDDEITATPRSWEKFSDLLKAYEKKEYSKKDSDRILFNICKGKIGKIVGNIFMQFYNNKSKLVSVEDLYNEVTYDFEIDSLRFQDIIADIDERSILQILNDAYDKSENDEKYIYVFTVLAQIAPFELIMGYFKNLRTNGDKIKYKELLSKYRKEFLKYGNIEDWQPTKIAKVLI